jgi:hypothetical protein
MQPKGFEEEQAGHASGKYYEPVGRFWRLGSAGPACEMTKVEDDGTVHVEFVQSDGKMTCPLAEVLEDAVAETLP